MRADRHHPTMGDSLRVEDIKIILQILQVSGVCRGRRIKAHDVIITNRIGHDGKRFAFYRHREWLVPADIINVIDEAQVLKNSQGVRCAAQPERIETNRTSTRNPLDGIDAGLIPGTFLLGSHGILRLPRLAVPGRFVAAIDNLFGQFGMSFNGLADHVRRHLNAYSVPKIEQAGNALLKAILVPLLNG